MAEFPSPPRPGRRGLRHPGRVAVVAAGLLLAANLLVIGGLSQRNDPVSELPDDIVALLPAPGEVALRQGDIAAFLAPHLTGELTIDGIPIPADQTDVLQQGTSVRVSFRPGEDKVIEQLAPDRHRATITWWPDTGRVDDRTRAEESGEIRSYTWAFRVG